MTQKQTFKPSNVGPLSKAKSFINDLQEHNEINMPKISFCIPSKNNLRYLKTCISSIRENACRKDHDI